jgi:hypothetical protein
MLAFATVLGSKARGGTTRGSARRSAALDAGAGGVEVAELALDVPLQLLAVVLLEGAEFIDAVLDSGLLLVETGELVALLGLGLRNDAGGGGVTFGDESVALVGAFLDVLVVQTTGELEEVGRRDRLVLARGGFGSRDRNRDDCDGRGSDLFDSGRGVFDDGSARGLGYDGCVDDLSRRSAATGELSTELLVFLGETTKLDNDLVQEVIDLVLVVALAELGLREALVNNVFRS